VTRSFSCLEEISAIYEQMTHCHCSPGTN